jgi:flagellar basal-body rod protein FlgG
MIAQQRRHDTVTNNIANINTPGFKQDQAVTRAFPEMLISLVGAENNQTPQSRRVGKLNTGVLAEEPIPVYMQGDLQETSNAGDVALLSNIQVPGIMFDASGKYVSPEGEVTFQPQAFFTVLTAADQERYTRNGKFDVNNQGELVTSDGSKVLGIGGQPIVLNGPLTDYTITSQGQFSDGKTGQLLTDAAGNQIQLQISMVENPYDLVREGNGNFRLSGDAQAEVISGQDQVQLRQGFIERYNVDASQAMVDLMTAQRAYEANQKMIQYYDKSMEKAVNEVGRV